MRVYRAGWAAVVTAPAEPAGRRPVAQGLHPTAVPLHELARHAAHGHAQIAEAVREHAERAARERDLKRAAAEASRAAKSPPALGAGDDTAHHPVPV